MAADVNTTGWTIKNDSNSFTTLSGTKSYDLPNGNSTMSLTIHCDAQATSNTTDVDINRTINFKSS